GIVKVAIDNNLTSVFAVLPVNTAIAKKGEKVTSVIAEDINKYKHAASTIAEASFFEEYGQVATLSGSNEPQVKVILDNKNQVIGMASGHVSSLLIPIKEATLITKNRPFKAWANDLSQAQYFLKGLEALLKNDHKAV